ncbi:type I-C CRISPR-associated protein Cas8c/Csd1 [Clostridium estertheticum]|uniref:type I-C CRISPR-associated protein Cas8c/Csd1 n=1 Tax=Clostridium estertheticum TaxID=238834 RepID=UPI0013EEA969|nr:type I-C CRISPR-associated protein Cas8c/Csd1 [Clostridium estertheticum]MBZ9607293.1 type I-C CRISPR-associated protein Cas8c/Csd1 [Clostridium estertheticum]
MSWIQKLYDTYENSMSEVGVQGTDERRITLLPIAHSTQNAQIEIVINGNGEFRRARVLEKDEVVTIIPVTEDSATRSNGVVPHPLCDKLQYVAGDYVNYVDKKNAEKFYNEYIKQLGGWCNSPDCNKKVNAILCYLKKKMLISDLVGQKILVCDDNGPLTKGVKIGTIDQSDAFIRFKVEIYGEDESSVWLDPKVYESYINYYLSLQEKIDLCYVSGKDIPCSEKHPAKVRHTGDKAKLISANDTSGFTYRGRFADKKQVVSIGYETTQKAHNALRWLIEKQGYKNGDQVVIAWGTNNQDIPDPLCDTQDSMFGKEEPAAISTEKEFAGRLSSAIAGYGCDLDTKAEIVIMGLDAATIGRLSITYYREFDGMDFLNRIEHWHKTCIWKHTYKKVKDGFDEKGKPKLKHITFIGAPSPKDITLASYGEKVNDKLKKSTVERLLPCIIDGARLPYDIVNSTVNRASNPVAMEKWEWEKALTIACALVRKDRYDKVKKEEWLMALDENQKDRSYIFGRLIAIAQQIEEYALYTAGEKRDTNAERLMHQFKIHPYKTWGIITDKLKPYMARLGLKGTSLTELMTKVNAMMPYEEFTSQKKLDDSYILGYYCQRQVFIDEKNKRIEESAKKKLQKTNEGEN